MLSAGAIITAILGLSEPITAVNAQNISITPVEPQEALEATNSPTGLEATTETPIERSTTSLDNTPIENATTSTTTNRAE